MKQFSINFSSRAGQCILLMMFQSQPIVAVGATVYHLLSSLLETKEV